MKALRKIRTKKMIAQGGRCYYCGLPMWDEASGVPLPEPLEGLKKELRCTAEHLQARCDGGRDSAHNIVAACLHCNQTRHAGKNIPRGPKAYRAHVRQCMAARLWLNGRTRGGGLERG